jgi:hypothetical protein
MRIKIGTMGAKVSWHIHYATPWMHISCLRSSSLAVRLADQPCSQVVQIWNHVNGQIDRDVSAYLDDFL